MLNYGDEECDIYLFLNLCVNPIMYDGDSHVCNIYIFCAAVLCVK